MRSKKQKQAYGVDSCPPIGVLTILAIQHVLVIIIDLAIPVWVVKSMGGTPAQTAWMLQMSMLAISVGTLLQIQQKGIGSGYLIPHSTTSIFLAPSLLAAQSGGLAMVAGMTLFAGSFQIVLARVIDKLRHLFPLHLSGVILLINGCVLVHCAFYRLIGCADCKGPVDWCMPIVGVVTLMIMSGLTLKWAGRMRTYGMVVGMAAGYIFSLALGIEDTGMQAAVRSASLFALPEWQYSGFDFESSLCLPFLIAALAVSVKGSGLVVKGYQINNTICPGDRRRRLIGGLLADGVGTCLAGILGGVGSSMSAANVGLSIISRATARRIGYGVAGLFLLLVFFPKLTVVLFYMPQPVMGGTMGCIGLNLIRIGLQMVRSEPLNGRRLLTVSLSLAVGLWIELAAPALSTIPLWMASILSSAISATALLAFALHAFFLALSVAVVGWRHLSMSISGITATSIN